MNVKLCINSYFTWNTRPTLTQSIFPCSFLKLMLQSYLKKWFRIKHDPFFKLSLAVWLCTNTPFISARSVFSRNVKERVFQSWLRLFRNSITRLPLLWIKDPHVACSSTLVSLPLLRTMSSLRAVQWSVPSPDCLTISVKDCSEGRYHRKEPPMAKEHHPAWVQAWM